MKNLYFSADHSKPRQMEASKLSAEIDRLDFLKYVADENKEHVRNSLLNSIINEKAFFFPSGPGRSNINGRLFSFDPEELTEGGAIDLFNEIRPSLEKAGFKIIKAEQFFLPVPNSKIPDYRLLINHKVCQLGITTVIPFLLWNKIARKYTSFINSILRKNRIKERLYFMNDSYSDTELAFVTPEQRKFINSLGLNPKDRVYKMTRWVAWRPAFEILGLLVGAIFKKKIKPNN